MTFDDWWYQVHWKGQPVLENVSTERTKNAARMGWDAALAQRAEERRIGWIPVSERLPEPEIDVLVRGTNGFISIDSVESFEGFDVAVTHWMPLPDGPHGGGKDG